MGRIDLAQDPASKLFTLSAMAARPAMLVGATGDPYVRFEMIVDSGSNQTAISEDAAIERARFGPPPRPRAISGRRGPFWRGTVAGGSKC
jgi:hypothetical protein